MRIYSLIVIALIISGCYGKSPSQSPPINPAELAATQELDELNTRIIQQGTNFPASPADYLIGPADLLEVRVFETEALTSVVRVSSRGFVTLPLLGDVEVADLTAREAEEQIEKEYKNGGYLRDPHVSIFIEDHESRNISVIGAVVEPGKYELLTRQTVLDALANAKGLQPNAGRSIHLNRMNKDGTRSSYIIDVEDLLSGNTDSNIAVLPGDLILVPDSGTVFVEGAVLNPGTYPIKEGSTTLTQAIIKAGGSMSYAQNSDITLIRYNSATGRKVYTVNLDEINAGNQQDIVVKDRDAVIVGTNTVKKFFSGLSLNIGYGLVGVGYTQPAR